MSGEFVKSIAQTGYATVDKVGDIRSAIMDMVEGAAGGTNGLATSAITADNAEKTNPVVTSLAGTDISTGAGALLLDDTLQELSTVEQAAAQLVAAENRAQKQIHSVTGQ